MPFTLRESLADPRPAVAHQAGVIRAVLARSLDDAEYLDDGILDLIDTMKAQRFELPDKSSELSAVDAALMPLLELHRTVYIAQPVEEQLEPSELDLLSFGVTKADLAQAAADMGCGYLQAPTGAQPSTGLVVGIKKRILVCRNVTMRKERRCVVFILDTGAPVSHVCHDTLRAFGIDPESQPNSYVRAEIDGGVGLNLYIFRPDGPHNDLNVLGMDYMLQTDAVLHVNGRSGTVTLIEPAAGSSG